MKKVKKMSKNDLLFYIEIKLSIKRTDIGL